MSEKYKPRSETYCDYGDCEKPEFINKIQSLECQLAEERGKVEKLKEVLKKGLKILPDHSFDDEVGWEEPDIIDLIKKFKEALSGEK